MPSMMNQPIQVASSSLPEFHVVGAGRPVGARRFMLSTPEPAMPLPADIADQRALRASLADSTPRIPYEQVRRDLGLQ